MLLELSESTTLFTQRIFQLADAVIHIDGYTRGRRA
jgi:hypothetical protein